MLPVPQRPKMSQTRFKQNRQATDRITNLRIIQPEKEGLVLLNIPFEFKLS